MQAEVVKLKEVRVGAQHGFVWPRAETTDYLQSLEQAQLERDKRVQQLEDEKAELKEVHSVDIKRVQEAADEALKARDEALKAGNEARGQNNKLTDDKELLKAALRNASEQIDEHKGKIKTLERDKDRQLTQIKALKDQLTNLNTRAAQIETLEDQVTTLKARIAAHIKQAVQATRRMTQLEGQKAEGQARIKTLEAQVARKLEEQTPNKKRKVEEEKPKVRSIHHALCIPLNCYRFPLLESHFHNAISTSVPLSHPSWPVQPILSSRPRRLPFHLPNKLHHLTTKSQSRASE